MRLSAFWMRYYQSLVAYNKATDEDVARRFGISVQFARWRMNATGARKIAKRAFAKRGR